MCEFRGKVAVLDESNNEVVIQLEMDRQGHIVLLQLIDEPRNANV